MHPHHLYKKTSHYIVNDKQFSELNFTHYNKLVKLKCLDLGILFRFIFGLEKKSIFYYAIFNLIINFNSYNYYIMQHLYTLQSG